MIPTIPLSINSRAVRPLEPGSYDRGLALLDELAGSNFYLCTRGDVVVELLGEEMKKGEFRAVERQGDRISTVD